MQNTKINKHKKRFCKQVILTCAHKRKIDKAWRKNDGRKTKKQKALKL